MALDKLERYPFVVNSQDWLKFFGIIFITFDHVSTYFYFNPIMSILGNFGAPIFFFLAGYHQQKRIYWGYLWLGLFITLLTYLTKGYWFGNILVSFFIIKTILYMFPNVFKHYTGIFFCILPIFINIFNAFYLRNTFFEFGGFGLSYAFSSHLRRFHQKTGTIMCLVALTSHYLWMHFFDRSSYSLPFDYSTLRFHLESSMDYICVVLFYLIYLLMALSFIFFKMREWKYSPRLTWVILLSSRYSFEYYVLQMILFRIVAAMIGTYGSFII